MALSAGLLRNRVTLQARTKAPRPAGGFDEVWSTVWTRWGLLSTVRSEEKDKWQSDRGEVTHVLHLRGEFTVDLDDNRFVVHDWYLQPIKMSVDMSGVGVFTSIGVRRQFEEEPDEDLS